MTEGSIWFLPSIVSPKRTGERWADHENSSNHRSGTDESECLVVEELLRVCVGGKGGRYLTAVWSLHKPEPNLTLSMDTVLHKPRRLHGVGRS